MSQSESVKRRFWVRILSIAIIVGIALLKPKFDEWMAQRSGSDDSVAQSETQDGTQSETEVAASATESRSEKAAPGDGQDRPSLDDLLASIDDDPAQDSGFTATKASTPTASQTQTKKQQSGAKPGSTKSDKSNPKQSTAARKDSSKDTSSKTNPGGSNVDSGSKKATPRLGKLTLVKGTQDEFRSTAGLLYVPGSADGHRLKHVLKHAKDNPSKPVHGVFDGDREQITEWIDRAYLMGKKGEKGARKEQQRDRVVYTANLKERIGYVGGQKGKRNGNKECRYLRLVLQNGNEVVTAYPSDRM